MPVLQELLEQELGRIARRALDETITAEYLALAAEKEALHLLQQICAVLDDQQLSDFDCVEEIVCILEKSGLSVSRHDFG